MTNITQPMLETIEKELQQQVARLEPTKNKTISRDANVSHGLDG
jgi:hypothetical protein